MCPLTSPRLPFLKHSARFLSAKCATLNGGCTHRSNADDNGRFLGGPQITRNHYHNALTATRMDSSPQTPEAVDTDGKGRPPVPEARSHSIALPLMHTHTRLGLARLAHLHPHGGLRSTSQLNERNRIVRK